MLLLPGTLQSGALRFLCVPLLASAIASPAPRLALSILFAGRLSRFGRGNATAGDSKSYFEAILQIVAEQNSAFNLR
jgi:hypothetical protein